MLRLLRGHSNQALVGARHGAGARVSCVWVVTRRASLLRTLAANEAAMLVGHWGLEVRASAALTAGGGWLLAKPTSANDREGATKEGWVSQGPLGQFLACAGWRVVSCVVRWPGHWSLI